ncbi:hypothetical protein BIY23_03205 [Wolbachia pipientis]|uniref:GS catalytic domain-containing protein n=1 Tax=Wolbachia pipientis TaxID=955 RepID=A0A1E7QJI9_WOLPI|nr:hypothetical protein [Wolbachia pipientis]OEY86547.1 hypothetical protein BIY23_03205 [Wolbachia pipientis]
MIDLKNFFDQNSVKFIDLRFTDLAGKSFSTTYIADDKVINDVKLSPDIKTIFLDPFCVQSTAVILCDYGSRLIAKKAYDHILSTGIIDNIQSSFKIWFSIFDEVKLNNDLHIKLSPVEDYLSIKKHSNNECSSLNSNLDPLSDLRSEILLMMKESNIENSLYHKSTSSFQGVIKVGYSSFLESTDNIQKSKHVIRNVAHSYGKTVTFMPNPILQDNSNRLSLDYLLLKHNKNLSDIYSHYVGGVMKHIKAINAYSNPTINSYRKSLTCSSELKLSFPDAIANPYLCTAAILMAGLDGIQNKINITELQPARSLREALETLDQDREFLLKENVFTNEQIDKYIRTKQEEIKKIEDILHPAEFLHYYNI